MILSLSLSVNIGLYEYLQSLGFIFDNTWSVDGKGFWWCAIDKDF